MDALRALIDRQLTGARKARADAEELDRLAAESLAEFMRRAAPTRPEDPTR